MAVATAKTVQCRACASALFLEVFLQHEHFCWWVLPSNMVGFCVRTEGTRFGPENWATTMAQDGSKGGRVLHLKLWIMFRSTHLL